MIVSPCFEVKTFSPSIIYTYILIVVQINSFVLLTYGHINYQAVMKV